MFFQYLQVTQTRFENKSRSPSIQSSLGAIRLEQLDHARVAFILRRRQRRLANFLLRVDVGAILEQHRCDENVAAF